MNKLMKMRLAVHVARMTENLDAYRFLVGNLKKNDQLDDISVGGANVKMHLTEEGWEAAGWIHLA
jgi:hypothetical protein